MELDPELAQKLRLLAAALDVKFPDLVNNRLTAMVDRELPEALARMGYSPEGGGGATGGPSSSSGQTPVPPKTPTTPTTPTK